jgi:predicted kinase
MPEVFLLVGLTGAGKTTYSKRVLEPAGAVRLSVDEVVYARHGRYGIDYPPETYFDLYAAAEAQVHDRMSEELAKGHDVALDLGAWSRANRDEWKRRIEKAGARWRLLYFPASRAELWQRLVERNRLEGSNAPRVTEADLDDFFARFEVPTDEGEETIQPGAF